MYIHTRVCIDIHIYLCIYLYIFVYNAALLISAITPPFIQCTSTDSVSALLWSSFYKFPFVNPYFFRMHVLHFVNINFTSIFFRQLHISTLGCDLFFPFVPSTLHITFLTLYSPSVYFFYKLCAKLSSADILYHFSDYFFCVERASNFCWCCRLPHFLRCWQPRLHDPRHSQFWSAQACLPPQWPGAPRGVTQESPQGDSKNCGLWNCALHDWGSLSSQGNVRSKEHFIYFIYLFFLRDFIFKKTLFEKLQY